MWSHELQIYSQASSHRTNCMETNNIKYPVNRRHNPQIARPLFDKIISSYELTVFTNQGTKLYGTNIP